MRAKSGRNDGYFRFLYLTLFVFLVSYLIRRGDDSYVQHCDMDANNNLDRSGRCGFVAANHIEAQAKNSAISFAQHFFYKTNLPMINLNLCVCRISSFCKLSKACRNKK